MKDALDGFVMQLGNNDTDSLRKGSGGGRKRKKHRLGPLSNILGA